MARDPVSLLAGELLDDELELTLGELSRACRLPAETIHELVEVGVVEPLGRDPARWRFRGASVVRVRCAVRLQHDLGVNAAGAALAIDLLDEIRELRLRLGRLRD